MLKGNHPRTPPTKRHPMPRPPLRVLVVDDNADGRRTLGMLVRLWGHEANEAPDGPSALDAAESFRPDVVLLDIGLPGLSGYDVARRVRQRALGVRLVAVTGHGGADDVQEARDAGFDHHLLKPCDPEEVKWLLRSYADALGSPRGPS